MVSWIIDYFPEYYIIYIHIPLIALHKYRSVYENNRLFRKPPSLGPPLSCAKVVLDVRGNLQGWDFGLYSCYFVWDIHFGIWRPRFVFCMRGLVIYQSEGGVRAGKARTRGVSRTETEVKNKESINQHNKCIETTRAIICKEISSKKQTNDSDIANKRGLSAPWRPWPSARWRSVSFYFVC